MASRAMSTPALRLATAALSTRSTMAVRRSFQTSTRKLNVVAPAGAIPVRKPVGAFRGGILGFLSGAVLSGGALYYYVIDEYRVSNELLTEDIFALQSAVARIEGYVKSLEEKVRK